MKLTIQKGTDEKKVVEAIKKKYPSVSVTLSGGDKENKTISVNIPESQKAEIKQLIKEFEPKQDPQEEKGTQLEGDAAQEEKPEEDDDVKRALEKFVNVTTSSRIKTIEKTIRSLETKISNLQTGDEKEKAEIMELIDTMKSTIDDMAKKQEKINEARKDEINQRKKETNKCKNALVKIAEVINKEFPGGK